MAYRTDLHSRTFILRLGDNLRFLTIGAAALVGSISCAQTDRAEAARLIKSLESRRSAIRAIDANYVDVTSGVSSWARAIIQSGGGGQSQVAQLQAYVDSLRGGLSALGVYLGELPLREPESQLERSRLARPIHDNIASLEPLVAELSAAFLGYKSGMDPDHYPHAVREIAITAESIRPQPIPIDDVIEALRRRYSLTDEEIANASDISPALAPQRK